MTTKYYHIGPRNGYFIVNATHEAPLFPVPCEYSHHITPSITKDYTGTSCQRHV